jgi:hypothetical protein
VFFFNCRFLSRKEEVTVGPHKKLHIIVYFTVVLTSCLWQCSAVLSVLMFRNVITVGNV